MMHVARRRLKIKLVHLNRYPSWAIGSSETIFMLVNVQRHTRSVAQCIIMAPGKQMLPS